jgi:hypothetical protein
MPRPFHGSPHAPDPVDFWGTTKTHPPHPRHPQPHRHAITMNMARHQKTSPDKIVAARMARMVRMPFSRILEPKPAPTAAARCWSAQSAGKPLCCTEPASILGRGGSPEPEGQPAEGTSDGTRLTCHPATRFARERWPNRSATQHVIYVGAMDSSVLSMSRLRLPLTTIKFCCRTSTKC